MANYIDGFVFPVPRIHLNTYQDVAETVAEIWKEHGALGYFEYVGDDLEWIQFLINKGIPFNEKFVFRIKIININGQVADSGVGAACTRSLAHGGNDFQQRLVPTPQKHLAPGHPNDTKIQHIPIPLAKAFRVRRSNG